MFIISNTSLLRPPLASQADMPDTAQHRAHHIVTRALDDEIAHRSAAALTPSLAVFLEHRIAEEIRKYVPSASPMERFHA